MWKLVSLVVVSAVVVACAAGTQGFDLESAQRAHVQLDLSAQPANEAVAVERHVIAPKLPRVDRIAQRVRFELGDRPRPGSSYASSRTEVSHASHSSRAPS